MQPLISTCSNYVCIFFYTKTIHVAQYKQPEQVLSHPQYQQVTSSDSNNLSLPFYLLQLQPLKSLQDLKSSQKHCTHHSEPGNQRKKMLGRQEKGNEYFSRVRTGERFPSVIPEAFHTSSCFASSLQTQDTSY